MYSKQQSLAIQERSMKIAQELIEEDFDGWMTAVAVLGWIAGAMPKPLADEITRTLMEDVRRFPTYPKE